MAANLELLFPKHLSGTYDVPVQFILIAPFLPAAKQHGQEVGKVVIIKVCSEDDCLSDN